MDNKLEEIIFQKLNAPEAVREAPPAELGVDWAYARARLEEIGGYIPRMDALRDNQARRPLPDPPTLMGRVKSFFRRLVRKLAAWYVEPVAAQQSAFNSAATPAAGCMTELHRMEIAALCELERRAAQSDGRFERAQAAMAADDARLETLERAVRYGAEQTLQSLREREADGLALAGRLDELAAKLARLEQGAPQEARVADLERRGTQQERFGASLGLRTDSLEQRAENVERQLRLLRELGAGADTLAADESLAMQESSQTGEDRILRHIAQYTGIPDERCSYLDLGANHAKALSNTWYFYRRGARGVLVEANPALIPELRLYRSGDVILNRCVAREDGESVDFYVLSGDGLSTPDRAAAEAAIAENPALCIRETVSVETVTVNHILDTYFDGAPVFLSIDIEGHEEEILRGVDWQTHRPLAVVIEMIPYRATLYTGERNREILAFMEEQGYREYAFTGINSIFVDARRLGGQA